MEDIDKRMFYLMLSPTDGQKYAEVMGFSPPSVEVQELEIIDMLLRWSFLVNSGVMDCVSEASDWFLDLIIEEGKIPIPYDAFKSILTSFATAMLNTLIDNELIGVVVDNETYKGMQYE